MSSARSKFSNQQPLAVSLPPSRATARAPAGPLPSTRKAQRSSSTLVPASITGAGLAPGSVYRATIVTPSIRSGVSVRVARKGDRPLTSTSSTGVAPSPALITSWPPDMVIGLAVAIFSGALLLSTTYPRPPIAARIAVARSGRSFSIVPSAATTARSLVTCGLALRRGPWPCFRPPGGLAVLTGPCSSCPAVDVAAAGPPPKRSVGERPHDHEHEQPAPRRGGDEPGGPAGAGRGLGLRRRRGLGLGVGLGLGFRLRLLRRRAARERRLGPEVHPDPEPEHRVVVRRRRLGDRRGTTGGGLASPWPWGRRRLGCRRWRGRFGLIPSPNGARRGR